MTDRSSDRASDEYQQQQLLYHPSVYHQSIGHHTYEYPTPNPTDTDATNKSPIIHTVVPSSKVLHIHDHAVCTYIHIQYIHTYIHTLRQARNPSQYNGVFFNDEAPLELIPFFAAAAMAAA